MGINSLITYVFASRSRPDKFFKCLDNIRELSVSGNYQIICSLDLDDQTMNNDFVIKQIGSYGKVKAYFNNSYSKVHAINRELGKVNQDTKIIICMSDDFEFIAKGFDVEIRKDMEKYFPDTDGVLHYPDLTPNGKRLMTMSIIGEKYFYRTGYIYNPDYDTWYCDDEETQKAKLLHKYVFIYKQLFRHNHYLFGKGRPDNLNIKNDHYDLTLKDLSTFEKRKINKFGI